MKIVIFILLINFSRATFGQTNLTINAIDFVRIKNDRQKEAIFFYENNWKVYRDIAIQKNFIKSYRILYAKADTTTNFDLVLLTEYTDSVQFKLSEDRFQSIIKETRPNGPMLLNELKPNDFRQNVFFRQAETIFSSDMKRKQKK